jgi:uncharacterized membrane protein
VVGVPGWSLIIVSFGFPFLLLVLREKAGLNWLKKLNPIIICYIVGIVLANTGLVGEDAAGPLDLVQTITVALSIPLLLFSVDLSRSRSLTGRAGLSMILASLSIIVVVTVAHLIFRRDVDESAKVAGLVVGVYTGGTPNLAAISRALNVSQSAYLTVHTADLVLSAFYLLFVMTIAKKTLSRVLPAYRSPGTVGDVPQVAAAHEADSYSVLLKASNFKGILVSLGIALVVGAWVELSFCLHPRVQPWCSPSWPSPH